MSPMRVIAGAAKGRRLRMVPGEGTRPIPDRAKEALFNILGRDVEDTWFLDLFAGTGSVGIEALSRGAGRAVFVELHRSALKTIEQNLQDTDLFASAEVIQSDVFAWLERPAASGFDYVFIAPPQYQNLWERTLLSLDRNLHWLNPDGWVIVQIDPKEYTQVRLEHLQEFDQRKYGRTLLLFYEAVDG